jgi:hypothetical protein
MKGGLTYKDLDIRKLKARNLDAALEWLRGRPMSEELIMLERILRKNLTDDHSNH